MGWAVISQPSEVGGHYCVDKLWILDGARRVGVGGALLAELQAIADARKVYLFVEAMESDCARRGMLEKHGYINQGPIGLEGDVIADRRFCYAKDAPKT